MKLVLFTHYSHSMSASMPRFAGMIADGMRGRGHTVVEWQCPVVLGDKIRRPFFAKWLGYIDQFILFPRILRKRLKSEPRDTLFVVTDHALGPWVPLTANRPHVIHCHDFLAQRSALREFPENPTGLTGKLYQAFIRWGYRKGRNFISVSKKTQEDLHRFLNCKPVISEVVYNGLNYPFSPLPAEEAWKRLAEIPALKEVFAPQIGLDHRQDAYATTNTDSQVSGISSQVSCPLRFILHVGGNQWYKNREGVLMIYREYCKQTENPVPLLMIGREPTKAMRGIVSDLPPAGRVCFVTDATNEQVHAAYAAASVLLFPSLEEGFGWPIAEAMACECTVITTNKTPMTEVGTEAAFYIPPKPDHGTEVVSWAKTCAGVVDNVLQMPHVERKAHIKAGYMNIARFGTDTVIDQYEELYRRISASA